LIGEFEAATDFVEDIMLFFRVVIRTDLVRGENGMHANTYAPWAVLMAGEVLALVAIPK